MSTARNRQGGEDVNGQGVPAADAPLPAEAQRDLAELRSQYGREYLIDVLSAQGRIVWAMIHRDADEHDAHTLARSAAELRLALRSDYCARRQLPQQRAAAGNGASTEEELASLRARHEDWFIEWRHFSDGMRFDARSLDESSPRLVVATAEELDEAIAAVEAGTWTA